MTQINRGSEWRKWDLHIHTPASFFWKSSPKLSEITEEKIKEDEFEKFIKAINTSDISTFCIMDYWTFDWYIEFKKYILKYPDKLKKSVFPGMELRIESPTNYRLNIHVILSDELTEQQLIDFKSELTIRLISRKLSNDSLIAFAKTLDSSKAKHHGYDCPTKLSDEQLLELGCKTAEITKESLQKSFLQIPEGAGFIIMPYDTSDGLESLDWKIHPHDDNYFMQNSHIFETRKQENVQLFSGIKNSQNEPYFDNFFKTLGEKAKPCISGSDAHKYEDYGIYPSEKITWIKSQPTFEGLKQIIYEPTERVKIQKDEPDSNKLDQLIIDKVQFITSIKHFWRNKDEGKEIEISNLENLIQKIEEANNSSVLSGEEKIKNNDFINLNIEDKFTKEYLENIILIVEDKKYSYFKFQKFTPEPIYFNKNLNVIIGGKSSGKSILLYNIARTLLNTEKLGKIFKEEGREDEFNFRVKSDANPEPDLNYNFEIKTKVPDISQTRFDYDGNSILSEVIYIPQNYLIKLAEPEYYKKGEPLNKLIRNLIIEKEEFKTIYYDIFIARVKRNDEIRNTLIKNYFETKETIDELIVNLGGKGNKEDIEKVIKHNEGKILELKEKTGLGKKEIESYQLKQKEFEKIEKEESDLHSDKSTIKEFNRKSIESLKNLVKDIETLEIKTPQIKSDFIKQYQELKAILSSIESYNNNIDIDDKDNNIFQTQLEIIQNEKVEKEEELKPYKQNEETEKQIKLYEDSNKIESQKLTSIIEDEKNIEQKRKDLLNIKQQIFELYKETHLEYENVINLLKPRTESFREDNLEIKGKVKFNFPKLEKSMWNISNGKSKSYENWNIFDKNLKATSSYSIINIIDELQLIFEDIDNGSYKLRSSFSKEYAVEVLLDDYFYDYWEVTYKGDKIGSMSTGKASFVILMIIIGLSESPAPILIDQPEDNLDNRSISDDLVKYLKKKKKERQIILVTHNANIAVNADAENIIVANQRGQNDKDNNSDCTYQFDYINGALEDIKPLNTSIKSLLPNMSIREHIKDILEGGEIAFKKREEKYGFI